MKQGSIVVLPFPFTDLSSTKQRPCLIISQKNFNESSGDLIVLAITSNQKYAKDNLSIKIKKTDTKKGKLPKESFVKCQKVLSIHKSLIRKEVCIVNEELFRKIIEKFIGIFTEMY